MRLLLLGWLLSWYIEAWCQSQPELEARFSAGVTVGVNTGFSGRIYLRPYNRLDLSVYASDYLRGVSASGPGWRYRSQRPCVQVLYRQYWPGSGRICGDLFLVTGGIGAGPALVLREDRQGVWGAVGGLFCELWVRYTPLSVQAEWLFFYADALSGHLGMGPTVTVYYNFSKLRPVGLFLWP